MDIISKKFLQDDLITFVEHSVICASNYVAESITEIPFGPVIVIDSTTFDSNHSPSKRKKID